MSLPLEDTINEAVDRLVKKFSPEKIILFGSQARGTSNERSDVDFLIIKSCNRSERFNLLNEMYRELGDLMIPIDIIILSNKQFLIDSQIIGTIARPALKEGKILYSNGNNKKSIY